MSGTMTPDALVPGPDCARYANVLPALAQDGADADTLAQARAHVAGCAYCAAQLAAYDALDAALARQHGDASGFPALDVAAIMRMTDMDEPHGVLLDDADGPLDEARPRHTRPLRRPSRRMADLAGIAAAILVVITVVALILSHTGFPRQAGPRKPTPTPGITPTPHITPTLHVMPTLPPGWAWYRAAEWGVTVPVPRGWSAAEINMNSACAGVVELLPPGAHPVVGDIAPAEHQPEIIEIGLVTGCAGSSGSDPRWHAEPVPVTVSGSSATIYDWTDSSGETYRFVQATVERQQYTFYLKSPAKTSQRDVALFLVVLRDFMYGLPAEPAPTSTTAPLSFTLLHMVSPTTGWAVTSSGLARTTDSGLHWTIVTPHGAQVRQNYTSLDVTVISGSEAWVADAQSPCTRIWHTTDGGQNWIASPVPLTRVQTPAAVICSAPTFVDAQHGWMMEGLGVAAGSEGEAIYRTTDGGQTWSEISDAMYNNTAEGALPFSGDKTGIAFINASTGWVTGTSAAPGAWLYVTHDGGQTWSQQTLTLPTLPPMGAAIPGQPVTNAPVFFSSTYGVLPVTFGNQLTYFYVTHDAGQTWTPAHAVPSGGTGAWSLVDASHWVIIGLDEINSTSDAGQSWTMQSMVPFGGAYSSLDMVSPSAGFAIGSPNDTPPGNLLKTTDGGRTWTKVPIVVG